MINQKKKARILTVLGICCAALMGCGNAIPEMTQEEESMVVTYAVDLLAQYSPDHTSRLIDTEKEAARRAEIAEKAAAVQAIVDANKKAQEEAREKAESELANTDRIDAADQQPQYAALSDMGALLEMGNLELSYEGCEITKNYGENETSSLGTALDSISADPGKNLCIIKLRVSNHSGQSEMVNVISQNVIFKIGVNDAPVDYAMTAMLMNDLSYASETIEPGDDAEYILVTQVKEDITQVEKVIWNAEKGGSEVTVRLQ